jgi:ketosteroid isomerase-like protein
MLDAVVVGESTDGDDAIKKYKALRPDVMVLDLRMPTVDGIQVVETILELDVRARIPDDAWERMSAAANEKVVRDFFVAFGTADEEHLRRLVHPDLLWHFPGRSVISGDFKGIRGLLDGIRATAMTIGQGKNGFELLRVLAQEDFVVTVHRDFSTDPDNPFDLRFALFITMEEGRMREVWEVPFDQAESDRYWNGRAASFAQARATR